MRIVSGILRGRIIQPPKNLRARPTTDFAKENLFNVIESHRDIEGADVLDLFAGTGSISYEFASRGPLRSFRSKSTRCITTSSGELPGISVSTGFIPSRPMPFSI